MDSYKSLDDELIEQFEISELYKDEEVDRETLKEMEASLTELKKSIEAFEITVMLSGKDDNKNAIISINSCLLYTSPSPRDQRGSRMPSSA